MEDYSEYFILGEPDKRNNIWNGMIVIGLQYVVGGLTLSNYRLEAYVVKSKAKLPLVKLLVPEELRYGF